MRGGPKGLDPERLPKRILPCRMVRTLAHPASGVPNSYAPAYPCPSRGLLTIQTTLVQRLWTEFNRDSPIAAAAQRTSSAGRGP